jgi:hypothetical protein
MNKRHRTRINHKRTLRRRRDYHRACQSVRDIATMFTSIATVIGERTAALTVVIEDVKRQST